MKTLTTLLVVGMFLMPVVLADDVEDVKAAIRGHFDAVNSGDVTAYTPYYANQGSAFGGGELLERLSVEQRKSDFQATVDSGLKRNLQMRNLEVQIYGNVAVATGYLVGSTTSADGTTQQTRQQRTGVLIKQGGQWKEVHRHNSPLQFPQQQSHLEGTWKTEEITLVQGPNAGTIADPQPSLFIFTKRHYNIMYVRGTEPRPLLGEEATRTSLTEAEVRATFEPFVANSGTYELSGSTLTTYPQVALWPNFMSGETAVYDYRVEGDSLWLTYSNGARLKLARVE